MNLTELLVTQSNVDEISDRFGLSEEQALEAMAAVIPAFSEGFKRQTSTPEGATRFIEALASGRHGRYAENPGSALDDDGMQEGNAILGHLFGNKQVSRAVAKQAAAETGISDSMFKSLLPAMASMAMGSLFKGATSSNIAPAETSNAGGLEDLLGGMLGGGGGGDGGGSSAGGGGGGILGQIIEGLAGGLLEGAGSATRQPRRRRRRAPTRRSGSRRPTSLEDLLGEVLGGGTTKKRRRTTRSRSKPTTSRRSPRRRSRRNSGGGMLDGILDELIGGGKTRRASPGQTTRTTPMPEPRRSTRRTRSAPAEPQDGGLGDIFGDFLEPGGNTSSKQRRQTGSIFDEFLEG
ncbi:MAG: DUF937 domain-containing protein [Rhizobiaceae bacterium]